MSKSRIKGIDVATGITIILVVSGHLSDYEPEWYGAYKSTLYKFHMPLFLFISGFIFSYNRKKYSTLRLYVQFILDRLKRFGIPFLFMSLLFLFIKIFFKEYDSDLVIYENGLNIFLHPTSGPAIFLWYIYVLILYYATIPLFLFIPLIEKRIWVLPCLGLALLFLSYTSQLPGLFELDSFFKYFFYFTLGFVNFQYWDFIKSNLLFKTPILLLIFIPLVFIDIINIFNIHPVVLSVLSIPSTMYIGFKLENISILSEFGKKSFTIYLWNSVFIFLSSFMLSLIFESIHRLFVILGPLLLVMGLFGPLLLRGFVRKINLSFLNKIVP